MAERAVNPFIWSDAIDDLSRTVSRGEFTERIALHLKSGTNVALFGPRGTGKTTFTLQLAAELERRHGRDAPPFATVLINLMDAISLQATIGCVARALSSPRLNPAMRGEGRRQLERVGAEFGFDFRVIRYTARSERAASPQSDAEVLHATLGSLLRLGPRLVVVFDEFQRLHALRAQEPLAIIRSALMGPGTANTSLLFTGSIRAALAMMFDESRDPLFDQASKEDLPRIGRADFGEFLELHSRATRRPFSDEAIAHLLAITNAHPKRTQHLAWHVWNQGSGGRTVGLDGVERGLESALASLGDLFTNQLSLLLNSGSPVDQDAVRVLHTMAAHGWTTRAAVLQRYGIKRRQDIYPARERLLRLGLVEQDRDEGGWSIVDPLFATWLRRRPGLPA